MSVLVTLDGELADPSQPCIRAGDLGLMRGDGIFETVLFADGRVRQLDEHLDRLERSAALLDMPAPDRKAWQKCVEIAVAAWEFDAEMSLTLVDSRGLSPDGSVPTGFAYGIPVSEQRLRNRETGVAVMTLDRGFDPNRAATTPWLLLGAKTLSYATNMAALRHARANGVDDAIFVTADGSVLEGPNSTVVVASGRTLRTPPAASGILPGTTQAALFRGAEAAGWRTRAEPLRVEDLTSADGVFLTSATHKVTRVHTLDGSRLNDTRSPQDELVALYDAQP
jgi:4-amino-4-deoxychorismate lyase